MNPKLKQLLNDARDGSILSHLGQPTSLNLDYLPAKDEAHGSRYVHNLAVDVTALETYLGGKSSGSKCYPRFGGISWHTNSDYPGIRVYCSFTTQPGSFFRTATTTYFDEPNTWNIRAFRVPMWHCVYAAAERYAFGFQVATLIPELERYLIVEDGNSDLCPVG